MNLLPASILPPSPPANRVPPELRDTSARFRFELDDGDPFVLNLGRGRLDVGDAAAEPDCVIRCPARDAQAVLSGESNLLTAFMRGDIQLVSGSLELAKRLYRYLRLARSGGAAA
jgi:putative sterol carrier protein